MSWPSRALPPPIQQSVSPSHAVTVAVLPRGSSKTTTAALIGLHHLLTVEKAAVTIAAASRDQARIAFERMRGFAQHPVLADLLVVRHLEPRHEDEDGLRLLRVISSDGPRAHGLSSWLYIGDEVLGLAGRWVARSVPDRARETARPGAPAHIDGGPARFTARTPSNARDGPVHRPSARGRS